MTRILTQEIRCKIGVWQEACGSVKQTQRLYNGEFEINSAPTRQKIYAIYDKFMAIGFVVDTQRSGRPRDGRSEEKIQELEEAYALSQGKSRCCVAVELDISKSSIQRMLRFGVWGFVQSRVCSTRPQNLEELKQPIRASCGVIAQDLLQSFKQKCVKIWQKCLEIGGFTLRSNNMNKFIQQDIRMLKFF